VKKRGEREKRQGLSRRGGSAGSEGSGSEDMGSRGRGPGRCGCGGPPFCGGSMWEAVSVWGPPVGAVFARQGLPGRCPEIHVPECRAPGPASRRPVELGLVDLGRALLYLVTVQRARTC